ncbi:Ubiquitin-like domain-containing CTD phosphatase 1 [Fukomys damarensis]|uniref:Ubiquitin-like domain-containing CTD phosphatase 1 n=1 Tax=Fukomys damarensis TaxID=885580 RepID=A0A091DT02_FUKDA|nr:Ubiquitin-like domain-containing CTD phosphatase 1 [Fukomys damarensis]
MCHILEAHENLGSAEASAHASPSSHFGETIQAVMRPEDPPRSEPSSSTVAERGDSHLVPGAFPFQTTHFRFACRFRPHVTSGLLRFRCSRFLRPLRLVSPRSRMALPIIVKWGGQEYSVTTLSEDDTVLDLKQFLKTLTGVLPERQKLLGLKVKGKPAENDVKLGALKLKPNTKIMMMGTREESLEDVLGPPPDNDDVVNDFDIEDEVVEVENREENLLKISRRVKEYKVEILNPPREGKKLLVLDVDYTLFDHRSCAETGVELMRPYLHEFLTSAYEDYDIVIWSATNMKWIEAKMKELGVSTNANYKITFMLDSAAMITVHTPRRGLIDVKPLGVIWGKFSEFYSKKNTIMFDDIGRNFLMNPQNGLKIRPFMKAHLNRDKDKELLKLTQYLKEIAKLDDFLELNHKYWERYLSKKQGQ